MIVESKKICSCEATFLDYHALRFVIQPKLFLAFIYPQRCRSKKDEAKAQNATKLFDHAIDIIHHFPM